MQVQISATDDVEWFQHGPTTHLTEDGTTSLCGVAEKPTHVSTHPVEDGDLVCPRCARIHG